MTSATATTALIIYFVASLSIQTPYATDVYSFQQKFLEGPKLRNLKLGKPVSLDLGITEILLMSPVL